MNTRKIIFSLFSAILVVFNSLAPFITPAYAQGEASYITGRFDANQTVANVTAGTDDQSAATATTTSNVTTSTIPAVAFSGGVTEVTSSVPAISFSGGVTGVAASTTISIPAGLAVSAADHSVSVDGVTIDLGTSALTAAQVAATIVSGIQADPGYSGKNYTVTNPSGANITFTRNATGAAGNGSLTVGDANFTSTNSVAASVTVTIPAALAASASDHSITIDGIVIDLGTSSQTAAQIAAAIAGTTFTGKDYTVTNPSGANVKFTKNSAGAAGNVSLTIQDADYTTTNGVKATRTLTVNSVPTDGQTITVGTCVVTFSSVAVQDTDCSVDNAAAVNTSGGNDNTASKVAARLQSLSNVSDSGHGALTVGAPSGTTVSFTTSGAEASATQITFTDGTSGNISSTSNAPGVVLVTSSVPAITFSGGADVVTSSVPAISLTGGITAVTATATSTVPAGLVASAHDHSVTIDGVTIDLGTASQTATQIASTIAAATFTSGTSYIANGAYTVSNSGTDTLTFTRTVTGAAGNAGLTIADANYTTTNGVVATATSTIPTGLTAGATDHSVTIDGVTIDLSTSALTAAQIATAIAGADFSGGTSYLANGAYTVSNSGTDTLTFTRAAYGTGGNNGLTLGDANYGAATQVNTITVSGTVDSNDIFTAHLPGPVDATYTVTGSDTTTGNIATGLNNAILASTGYGAQAFTSGVSGSVITLTAKVAGTGFTVTSGATNRSAVAQVVTFTPTSITVGETERATINGTNYDKTNSALDDLSSVLTALASAMDANSAVACSQDGTRVTCTASPPGTPLDNYAATVVDITAPTVTSVTSSLTNGPYKAGQVVPVTVTFSEAVNVVGTPQLQLETGTPDELVNYTSGSGSNTLLFNYTVQSGDTTSDLDYLATNALTLNGGTIKDAAGNDAIRTLASTGAAGSLGANRALVIDTTAPSFASSNPVVALKQADGSSTSSPTNLWYYYSGQNLRVKVTNIAEANGLNLASVKICTKSITGNNPSSLCSNSDFTDSANYISLAVGDGTTATSNDALTIPAGVGGFQMNIQLTDQAGNSTIGSDQIYTAVFNINPKTMAGNAVLNNSSTTDWSTITDFTNVPIDGLVFNARVAGVDVGKLTFKQALNLTDSATITGLAAFGTNMTISANTMRIDSSALAALNKSAQLMMSVSSAVRPGLIVKNDAGTAIGYVSNSESGTPTVGADNLSGFTWDATAHTLTFNTSGFSEFDTDNVAPTLNSFTSTTSSGTYGPSSAINITANYSEALGSGSTITVVLNNGQSVTLSTRSGSTLSGTYTVGSTGSSQDTSVLSVSSISSQGAVDLVGNQLTNTSVPGTNITAAKTLVIDTTAPVFSSVSPDNSSVINKVTTSSQIGYTLSKSLVGGVGSVIFTRTGGVTASNHTCTLVGTALASGAHTLNLSDTTNGCTSAVTLTDGAIYSLAFDGTDAAGNAASTITRTGINYVTAQTGSGQALIQSSTTVTSSNPQIVVGNIQNAATVTVPSSVTNATLDITSLVTTSGGNKNATIPSSIQINADTSAGSISVGIPAGITISGASGSWDGIINMPTVKSTNGISLPSENGVDGTSAVESIEVGAGDVALTFDKAVRLLLPGQATKSVGFLRNGVFTEIKSACSADDQTTMNSELTAGADCKINVGSDMVIWTKHFSQFVSFDKSYPSVSLPTYSTPGAPVCGDSPPTGAPQFVNAVAGANSVTLTWRKAPDPVTYYLITYGEKSGAQTYGNPSVGGADTTSYTVGGLSGGTTYYFRVRAGNGCTPGPYSGEISATPGGAVVSGIAPGFIPGVLGSKVLHQPALDNGAASTGENEPEVSPAESQTQSNVSTPQVQQPAEGKIVGGLLGAVISFFAHLFGR